jgi:hypothetical protein
MGLETGTYISDLVVTNPTASDPKSQGDDHLRLLKNTIKATFANVTGAVTPTHTQFNFLVGVTSAIQTQLNARGLIAGQTWTGTHAFASTTSIGTVTAAEIARLSGVTSAIQTQIDSKGAITGQTWTGTHVLPATTSIGTVSATEIGYLDNVTSPIQTQLDAKAPLASPALTGVPTAPTAAVGTNTTQLATMAALQAAAFLAVLPSQAGNARKFVTTDGATASWASVGVMDRRAITGADTVGLADVGQLVDVTAGTFTLAFAAAATLGDQTVGWVQNSGTGNVTLDPNGAETIDGRTNYIMYPGEIRKWYVEGSTIKTVVEKSFSYTITATGTFIPPPGYAYYEGEMWNGGNSGEFNNLGGTSTSGGGSACLPFAIPASALNTAGETVTIGAGGTAKVANSVGAVGGATSIGTVLVMPVAASAAVGSAIATEATAFYSGAAGSAGVGNGSTFGAASGGGYNGAAQAGGTSKLAGNGGAGSTTTATAGVAPGGGGGAAGSATAVASGAGARGECRIRGRM